MPAPDPDFIVAPAGSPVSVAVEPAQNALNSLLLLVKADKLSGLDEWVIRTSGALTPEQRHNNRLVLLGLHYAVVPDRSWPSFPAYVDHLAAQDPITMRDRVFNAYAQFPEGGECCDAPDPTLEQASIDTAPLLQSVDAFLEFLAKRFPAESLDHEIESEAHRYLNDPPSMQSLLVSHFRSMWEGFLAPEWDRVAPMLRASADAFQQLDLNLNLNELSKFEAAQLVLGRALDERWEPLLEQTERLIFVPSAHVGPYAGKFRSGDTLWVLFGARIPEGVPVYAPDLSRAEILVRLNALADDTRLRILKLIAEGGEQRSQDIMTRLELSQSAVSRHLKQLSATGYVNERRCEGAKCYTLNPKRIEDTLRAVSVFLLDKKE
jgi:DNA-binding transcriptional ArsR family regulator